MRQNPLTYGGLEISISGKTIGIYMHMQEKEVLRSNSKMLTHKRVGTSDKKKTNAMQFK